MSTSKRLERPSPATQGDRKRAAVKELIERYYYQLTNGCGNPNCNNENCASNANRQKLNTDQAAALALELVMRKARLCYAEPVRRKSKYSPPSQSSNSFVDKVSSSSVSFPGISSASVENCSMDISNDGSNNMILNNGDGFHSPHQTVSDVEGKMEEAAASSSGNQAMASDLLDEEKFLKGYQAPSFLDEKTLLDIIEKCKRVNNYSLLIRTLGHVFSNEESLKVSFVKDKSSQQLTENLSKEDIRAMEVDEDKDKDSKETEEIAATSSPQVKNGDITVDIDSVRRAFSALFAIPQHPFQCALINALIILSGNLEFDFKYSKKQLQDFSILNIFTIIMEIPMLECPEYLEAALPAFCKAAALLPLQAQAKLAQFWSKVGPTRLREMVISLNQLITLKAISGCFNQRMCVHEEETIIAATKLMKILYYANMLGGEMDSDDVVSPENEVEEGDDIFPDFLPGANGLESKEPKQPKEDPLNAELGIKPLHCIKPLIGFEEFYNEPLSDQIEMDKDYAAYRDDGKFSFMNYSFILTPSTKSLGLYFDNRIRMYSERRISVLHSLVHGSPANPYLRLRVRRDHLIDDSLVGLEMVAMENPNNLKKQLVVEFEGEQGIDEGGVSKEFFQLVVQEVFNPDFAMFTLNPETQTYWFNPTSFESDAQFTLIGIMLGLAIYNSIILDVRFPMVLYRKLMGKRGTYHDLGDWNSTLSRSLMSLLAYEEDDIEQTFLQTFRISYEDVFGTVLVHDLKENGDQILVNHANKKEFVQLYADFLLNKSVEKQFRAFKRGFQMVTDDSPIKLLFRPEEVELLVCGSQNLDFAALEETTEYDGGYLSDTPIVRWFWELVHEFSPDQKKKLLEFTTGSDRVPIGGLSKLKLVIARNGPDSDRLPTAHTCFNVLLLPEYDNKEKLEDRLLKAINYSKGFGML